MSKTRGPLADSGMIQLALAVAVAGYVIAQVNDSRIVHGLAFSAFMLGSLAGLFMYFVYMREVMDELIKVESGDKQYLNYVVRLGFVLLGFAFMLVIHAAVFSLTNWAWFVVFFVSSITIWIVSELVQRR